MEKWPLAQDRCQDEGDGRCRSCKNLQYSRLILPANVGAQLALRVFPTYPMVLFTQSLISYKLYQIRSAGRLEDGL